jgi:hypothetical protein
MKRTILLTLLLVIGIVPTATAPARADYPDCEDLPYDAYSGKCRHENYECQAPTLSHVHEVEAGQLGVITGDDVEDRWIVILRWTRTH